MNPILEKRVWFSTEALDSIQPDPSWSFEGLKPSETNYATHGYHRYPAKFIPQLAERLILSYSEEGDRVVDPFMGSGTTLVEAKKWRRPSIGTDINPVAHLIAEAKVSPVEPAKLHFVFASDLYDIKRNLFSLEGMPDDSPSFSERLQYWFAPETLATLWQIHQAIESIPAMETRPFFRCAFSNILKPCSYWSNRSVKPVRKLDKPIPDPISVFHRQVKKNMLGNRRYYEILSQRDALEVPARPFCLDARHLPCEDDSVTLIVTSPPYVTSYEYADLHQLTVLWYRYASTREAFRSRFIGTSAVNGKPTTTHSRVAGVIVNQLAERSPQKAKEVAVYFSEMFQCFCEMRRVLKRGGRACIVIGNTEISGVPIQNAQVFVDQMHTIGFDLERVILREIPSKILPTTRDRETGRFARKDEADSYAYPRALSFARYNRIMRLALDLPNCQLYQADALKIDALPPESVDLIVTSPPYNVEVAYGTHADDMRYEEYLQFSQAWMRRCHEWLKEDGRFCMNIPLDKNKGGQQSVGADLTILAKQIGFQYHATIVWNEGNISRRTAWGSWKSASAPYVIAPVELIVVLYKKRWRKMSGSRISDITAEEFIEWTNGLWCFNGESAKRVGHPAPFPVELPKRCIKLFSYVGDTILDPFSGSGTTLIASLMTKRQAIGIEIDPNYCALAVQRICEFLGGQQYTLFQEGRIEYETEAD